LLLTHYFPLMNSETPLLKPLPTLHKGIQLKSGKV
jgi:hypothetical protein